MQEALPFDYLPEKAGRIQPLLQRMVQTAFDGVLRSRKG